MNKLLDVITIIGLILVIIYLIFTNLDVFKEIMEGLTTAFWVAFILNFWYIIN